jgi:CubicO group peptidase (beta-lactamase class C family)
MTVCMTVLTPLWVRSSAARAPRRRHVALLAAAALAACSDAARDPSDASETAREAGLGDGSASVTPHDAATTPSDSSTVRDADTPTDASTPLPSPDATTPDAAAPGTPTIRPTACAGKPLPPRALGKSPPFAVGPESAGLPPYWPTAGWRKEDPEKLGFDAAKLAAAVAFTAPNASTQAVLVVRHGYVAAEVYSRGFSASMQHESYSMAKSFSSGLVGIALAEGKLGSTNDKICDAYPMQWSCTAAADPRSRITLEHALNLSTGLDWREDWRSSATGRNDALSLNLLDVVLAKQSVTEPGAKKRYSTGDPALLSGALQKATGMTALQYAKQKIFDVIGTPGIRWNADLAGRTTTYAGLQASAAEYAKYGYLYLQRGAWDGKQVIPAEWVERTTQAKHPCEDWNQYLWHVNPPVRLGKQDPSCDSLYCPPVSFADLPHDAFFAEGVYGQFMFVVPSADMVVVRLAADTGGLEHWEEFARGFFAALLDALR